MMRRYPAYRESGVDWLGEVPEGWGVKPLRQLIRRIESGTSVNAIDAPATEGEVAVLKTSCVYAGVFDPGENKVVVPDEVDRVACPLRLDALIVSRMNTPDLVGAAGHVTDAAPNIYLPDRLWQITFDGLSSRFAYFFTLSPLYRDQVRIACAGTSSSMQNLAQDDFKSFLIPLPPLSEQTAIAAFLDRETGKIDALVAEQRRLIDLLREKRQATISHAVTRGLNPAAPLKPSGVDWLGDVPEGWEVCSIKFYCARITDGAHISPDTQNGAFPFVSTKDVTAAGIDFQNCLQTSEETYRYMVATGCQPLRGDILFSKDGTIGRTVIVDVDLDFVVASSLIIIRPYHSRCSPRFLNYLCQSSVVTNQVASFVKGAGLPRLSITNLLKVIGIFPPLGEQEAISDLLDNAIAEFDSLTTTAESAISLLLERRAALISAAVTGKIDVREAQAA